MTDAPARPQTPKPPEGHRPKGCAPPFPIDVEQVRRAMAMLEPVERWALEQALEDELSRRQERGDATP